MRSSELTGWGRYPRRPGPLAAPRTEAELRRCVANEGVIARGNGRAYGDSAIGAAATVDMRAFNRFLSFDAQSGQLVAQAGVLLGDIIETFLPRGWFPYVTPGTKFVSLGGAIAANVHGKNHHCDGSFGQFVDWIDVMGADGQVRRASLTENPALFSWTLGGMGLTGVILRAAIRLRPVESAFIRQKTVPASNLDAAIEAFEAAHEATYSVAWIDCLASGSDLGRSLIMLGEHATADELSGPLRNKPLQAPRPRKKSIPFDLPAIALNALTVKAFNGLYWRKGKGAAGDTIVDWDRYFYPLDAILGWNRIYGRRGFLQFQCALPLSRSKAGLTELLEATSQAGQGSFLAVLKRFGAEDSRFSFPMEGYTLALDFPANARTLALFDRLDAITVAHGGRFYLAKDARLAATTLHKADPRARDFADMRRDTGLDHQFASSQSERLRL